MCGKILVILFYLNIRDGTGTEDPLDTASFPRSHAEQASRVNLNLRETSLWRVQHVQSPASFLHAMGSHLPLVSGAVSPLRQLRSGCFYAGQQGLHKEDSRKKPKPVRQSH